MAETKGREIPGPLADLLSGRDRGSLADGAFLRWQYIGLTPAIIDNRRFVLDDEGRLFGAINTDARPQSDERFNVAIPDEPTTTLSAEVMDEVRAALVLMGFFDSPIYVASEGTRDGAAVIVTARGGDGDTHEVWYVNVDNQLTDLLWSLPDGGGVDTSDSAQVLADLERIKEELS
jgi:hypothetical protein